MRPRAATRLGLGAAGLCVAAAVAATAAQGWRRDAALEEAFGRLGAAAATAETQAAFGRLSAAAAVGEAETAAALLPALRGRLAALIAEETRLGRLAPTEIAALARLANALDAGYAGILLAGEARAGALAALAGTLAVEADALAEVADSAARRERAALGEIAAGRAGAAETALIAAAGAATLFALLAVAASLGGRGDPAAAAEAAALRLQLAESQLSRGRFVAMMSHELRTPMNGVLGLLALLKESGPSPAALRLIDQAERAGLQLNGMLADMLEVEGAAAAPPRREPNPEAQAEPEASPAFRLKALARAMRDLYAPVAARNGVDFKVRVRSSAPERATGDGRRLQRALSHLCSHILDRAGVRDVRLDLDHDGRECRAALSFEPPAGGGALGLDQIAGSTPPPQDAFTGQGLGPLLARGLVESMGGRLELTTLESGRVMILAATPSAAAPDRRPRVRVIAQSRSLGALGAAAATSGGVDVLSLDEAPDPDVVLIEAGGAEERRAAEDCRARWPSALLASLGPPESPELFDHVIQPPLAPKLVAESVDALWAARDKPRGSAATQRPRAFAERAT